MFRYTFLNKVVTVIKEGLLVPVIFWQLVQCYVSRGCNGTNLSKPWQSIASSVAGGGDNFRDKIMAKFSDL